ncbi:MAG: enoyl-CoA hydratase [Rhodospirillaceae bacterium]|jgi:enoyl-CoA hydratase|nr:enoyl-CoA hydratase [Rhodospirillaceae bacterium]MBT4487011.1 enoyl-CoA hydratase [Rhodospirillaceae bacterium]MBT5194718.1 enoyl-CoA hydratase [Rhodospirillaceae bacterium]MBT5894799.1 enoyl-CoA hydratase [Rhodospirillaceae bacterium]MBT6427292.1 enoyl-CoA hydratase [Rhodospirillaceae bacterium]
MAEQDTYETITYTEPLPSAAQITLNRPQARNAQDLQMTYDLNQAFERAAADDGIKVIILAGSDPHFCAGHDLSGDSGKTWEDFPQVNTWGSFDPPGAEGRFAREAEIYLGMTERWRNVPKPTIAAVQGKCIAGGLMLAWACDIIIAADDAEFRVPVVEMGVCGVEFFAHPWEVGPRKAKEWLFTADWLGAEEARQLGMVNQVVPRDDLLPTALAMAERIARKPLFALKLTKEAVNQSQDTMGRPTAMSQVFSLHQLCHSHNMQVHGIPVDPGGLPESMRQRFAKRRAGEAGD